MKPRSIVALVTSVAVLVMSAVGIGLGGEPAVRDVERSKICMLQDKIQPRDGIEHVYQGQMYYLCCPMCASAFECEPERYSKTRDPVNGQPVDKAVALTLAYGDQAYFFQSEDTRAAFAKDPDRYVKEMGH